MTLTIELPLRPTACHGVGFCGDLLESSIRWLTLALSRAAWRQHTPAAREPAGRREPAQGVGSSALLAFVCAGSSAEAWRPSVCVLHNAPTGGAR